MCIVHRSRPFRPNQFFAFKIQSATWPKCCGAKVKNMLYRSFLTIKTNGRKCFKPTSYTFKDYACVTDSKSNHIYGPDNQKSHGKGSTIAKNGMILEKYAL